MSCRSCKCQNGFTLLELLLAISLLAVIGAASYQLISSTSAAISQVSAAKDRTLEIKQLQSLLRRDIHAVVRAQPLTKAEVPQLLIDESKESFLVVPRARPTSVLSYKPSSVSYILSSNKQQGEALDLYRSVSPDIRKEALIGQHLLLNEVSDLQIQLINGEGREVQYWPQESEGLSDISAVQRENTLSLVKLMFSSPEIGDIELVVSAQ